MSLIGTPVRRLEDYRFLTGQGTYTDDINRPGQLHAYILRSPHANARITGIETSAAASAPGVVAVYTGKDMAADGVGGLPCGWQIHSKDGSPMVEPPHPTLVTDRALHVGDQGIHALTDQPESACDPPADGRFRIAHPGGQAAGRRSRCRRRLRVEDLPLRRRSDRDLGCRQAEAANQMDGGTFRELHVGRA